MNESNHSDDLRSLCEMASKEQDPQKLLDLVVKINRALEKCGGQNDGRDTPSKTDAALPMAAGRRDFDFSSFAAQVSPAVECDC